MPPAVGVRDHFYHAFAQWLCDQGFHVMTFIYRGVLEDDPQTLKRLTFTLTDWGRKDFAAAIEHAHSIADGAPVHVVAHSIGGHMLGLLPNSDRLSAVITVASGVAYWSHRPIWKSWSILALWYLIVPISCRLFGYFPGRRLGWAYDLPCGIMRQFGQWSRHEDYMLADDGTPISATGGLVQFRRPILSLSFADDDFIVESAIDKFHSLFTRSKVERRHLSPDTFGLKTLGHFGFFRRENQTLWQIALEAFTPFESARLT